MLRKSCFVLALGKVFLCAKDSFHGGSGARTLSVLVLALAAEHARGVESTWEYAVQMSASIRSAPPQIALRWPQDTIAVPGSYTIHRKAADATSWDAGTTLPGTDTSFVDTNVIVGAAYEYQVVKAAPGYTGYGYIYAGINASLVEDRGKVILVVDETYAADLAEELSRLERDLVGDGWQVLRHDVARNENPANVKALIKADYDADPVDVKAVFLFGRIPVVRSGNLNVDGHGSRPMPADAFYGDMDGSWTDGNGDGIYDQNNIPSDVELEVGRVDFANMPGRLTWDGPATFPSELKLLRRYLDKDHDFRHALVTTPRRAVVGNRFGAFGGEAFAASGYRNFAPLVGPASVETANTDDGALLGARWISMLGASSYLWAYGCGGGSYVSMSGLGSHPAYNDVWSTDIVGLDAKAVFTMTFGSWFGDWDSEDNIMRAFLATPTMGLTCSWAGRPHHFYHHMGLGETIGYGIRLSQNNSGLYRNQVNRYTRGVHVALMGDPTLRMHPVSPPSALTAGKIPGGARLSWSPSSDVVESYHVYRATNASGPFTRLTSLSPGETNYDDTAASSGTYTYMVRAVKLEETPSGSYFNPSQGVFVTIQIASASGLPLVSVEATDADMTEGGSDYAQFRFTRAGDLDAALTVNFTLSGSATPWDDYRRYEGDLPNSVTFPVGVPSTTLVLHAMDDTTVEGDETVILTLVTDASYRIGSSAQATVTIRDDEQVLPPNSPPTITVTAVDAQASEEGPDPATFEFTRTGDTTNAVTVKYTLRGTATKWNDYRRWQGDMPTSITIPAGANSARLTVYPFDDTEVEGDETVVLTIVTDDSYIVGPTNRATVTITDNDSAAALPTVVVVANDAIASLAGPDPGTFTFTRSGDTNAPLTVNFALGGSATKWNDYRRWEGDMPESVTIPAGAASADLTIYPVGKPGSGGTLEVVLTIVPDAGYNAGATASASVSIAASALPITAISGDANGAMRLTWNGRPGQVYRVAFKNRLTDANWTDISNDISATDSVVSWIDMTTGEATQRFYLVYEIN